MAKKIYLYTISDSEHCRLAKALLKDLKVDYDEVNLDKDDDAKEELVKITGQWSVPALVLIDEENRDVESIVVGYEPSEIKKLMQR